MPMIDVYATAGTFPDTHQLAVDLAAAVMTIEHWEESFRASLQWQYDRKVSERNEAIEQAELALERERQRKAAPPRRPPPARKNGRNDLSAKSGASRKRD